MRIILLALAVLCLGELHAQFSTSVPAISGASNAQMAWADYDGDLNLDVAVFGDTTSSAGKMLSFYRNNSGTFSRDTTFTINENYIHIEWGDYDNDNDPDLLIGGQTLRIFINTPAGFVMNYPLGSSFYPLNAVHWGDFNHDGRTDILTGNRVYFNLLSGFTPSPSFPVYFDQAASATADFDGDGDLDFIITGDTSTAGFSTYTCIYSNNGNGTFTPVPTGASGAAYGDVQWCDYDQDGDLDFAILGRPTLSMRIFKIYRNNGGTFTDMNAGLNPVAYGSCAWGDFNNDGFPDLAYCGLDASTTQEAKILVNNGGTSFTDAGAGLTNMAYGDMAWADYDNDADLDLLAAGTAASLKVARLYLNGSSIANTPPTVPVGVTATVNANAVQISWNSSTDAESAGPTLTYNLSVSCLVCSTYVSAPLADTTSGWRMMPAFGSGWQTSTALINLPYGTYAYRVQAIDAAYAGSAFSSFDTFQVNSPFPPLHLYPANHSIGHFLSLVLGWNTAAGATTYHVQVATDSLFSGIVIDDSLLTATSHAIAGLNYNTTYYWRVRASHNTVFGAWSAKWSFMTKPNNDLVEITTNLSPLANAGEVQWVDFDNDDDMDLVMSGDTVTSNPFSRKVVFYTNTQGILSRITQPAVPSIRWSPKTYWADYDTDGDLDFVMMADAPQAGAYLKLFINDSGVFSLSTQTLPVVYGGSVDWGDYDNDGDPDLLICGINTSNSQGCTKILRNTGGIFTDAGINIVALRDGVAEWIDTDGDGDLDILLSGDTATGPLHRYTKIYRNNNATSFLPVNSGLEHFFFFGNSYDWGDLDNDGDADLLLTGDTLLGNVNNTDYQTARVYRNNGGVFSLMQVLSDSILGQVVLGDINNDGSLDVVLNGALPTPNFSLATAVWVNNGSGSFTASLSHPVPWRIGFGGVDLADMDNDLDLDIAISGSDSAYWNEVSKIYRNDVAAVNAVPLPPASLAHTLAGATVTLGWNAGSDAQTPAAALSYAVAFGTAPGNPTIVQPNSNLSNGYRRMPDVGNAGYSNTYKLNNLVQGWYYWQVQSIDAAGIGSAFSPVDSFYVGIPAIPVLALPADGGMNIPLQATLMWHPADSAVSYQVQVATDTNFSQVITNINSISDTFAAWQTSAYFTKYFWRVRALNSNGYSGWSPTWKFTSRSQFEPVSDLGWGTFSSYADYDSDGDLDILIYTCVSCPDSLRLLRNDSGVFNRVPTSLPAQLGSGGSTWGDYDNDGDPDLLLYGSTLNSSPYNPVTYVYQNNGGVLTNINAGLTGVLQADASWIDYDNDGDLDISYFGRPGASGKVFRLYRNTGGTFTQDSTLIPPFWWSSMDWGDYDNDGDYDLGIAGNYQVASTNYYTTTIYRNDTGTLVSTGLNLLQMGTQCTFRWVDVDNDGDLDISLMGVQPSATMANKIFINNYGVFIATNPAFILEWNNSADWADFDNDGDIDPIHSSTNLAVSHANNTIYKNNGAGIFAPVSDGLVQYFGTVKWIDYDGDGDVDILCRDSALHTILYRNTFLSNQFGANTAPASPSQVTTTVTGNAAAISWNAGSDAETPLPSLTYNVLIRRAGDTVFTSTPLADTVSGRRNVLRAGNAGFLLNQALYNLDSGTYVVRVQSLDIQHTASAFSVPDTFTVATPLAPTLVLPADSADVGVNIAFQWIAFPSAARYQLQVAYDALYTSVVFNDSMQTNTATTVNNLPPDTALYWHVRAWTGSAWSPWSGSRLFNTHTLFTTPFGPQSFCPYDSTSLPVTYTTSSVLLAGNITTIELSDASGSFASPLVIGALATTQSNDTITAVIPPALPAGTHYRLRTVTSLPFITGTTNGADLVILPQLASCSIAATDTALCTGLLDTLTASGTGYTNLAWSSGDTTQQIVISASGNYTLSVTDANGCMTQSSQMIYFENCSLVWPGDANEDLQVTTGDLLPIGVHFGSMGYARDTVTIQWAGHEAMDWGALQSNGENLKYADCDGDGVIGFSDTTAIPVNYGNTHTARHGNADVSQSGIPVFLQSMSNAYPPGGLVTLFVHVGSAAVPATQVYGGDFEIALPSASIQQGSATRAYVPSWLGNTTSDLLSVSHFGAQQQTLNFAVCRFDHFNHSGYGPLLQIQFLLDSTLSHGDSLQFSLSNCFLIDSAGTSLSTSTSTFMLYIDTTVLAAPAVSNSPYALSVYPNPFTTELHLLINAPSAGDASLRMVDLSGRPVGAAQPATLQHGINEVTVNVPEQLSAGIYFLEITGQHTVRRIKIVCAE